MSYRYLSQTPSKVSPGRIVVHNHVRPAEPLGMNGFRAWTEEEGVPNRARCSCGWAPRLKLHYRVKGV